MRTFTQRLDQDVLEDLMKLKKIGESYSDVIRRLIKQNKKRPPNGNR